MDKTTVFYGSLLNVVTIVQFAFTYRICSFLRRKPLGMQTLVDLVIIHTLIVQLLNSICYVILCHWAVLADTPVHEYLTICVTFLANSLTLVMCFFYLFTVIIKVGKQFISTSPNLYFFELAENDRKNKNRFKFYPSEI